MRQTGRMKNQESYLDGFQLGKRISENPRNNSFPRYQNAATSFKTKSCGISAKKCAPNLRQKIFQPLEVTTAPAGCPSKKMSVQKKVSLR